MIPTTFIGLEHLATAVIVVDEKRLVKYVNPAAENLFQFSSKHLAEAALTQIFDDSDRLYSAFEQAFSKRNSFTEHELALTPAGHPPITVSCTLTPIEAFEPLVLMEFHELDKQLKIAREERLLLQQQANRDLLRNLAHEVKNPLGGLRGAAQLLEYELPKSALREYTQVIIKEADRLQILMDRLLSPNRMPHFALTNIHEVLERVRSLLLAETPQGITIRRDYDASLPDLRADQEQLIQAVLNIMRNAVQAMQGKGEIRLSTRIARQVTLVKKRYRHAIRIQITDTGPGIPENIRETIFSPLVSGREGGSGLGLTIAQTYINQHQGTAEFESRPGHTCFTLLLPIIETEQENNL